MERLGKKDKAVIRAFVEKRALDGHKLDTDGTRLNIVGLGGGSTAYWQMGKIHLADTGSRSGQLVQRAVAREAPKNDLYNGVGYATKYGTETRLRNGRGNNPRYGKPRKRAISKMKYRAIKWRRSSDDITPVGEWHADRSEALRDAYADYAPHARAFYEIESSDGSRKDLTDKEMQRAEQWYHESIGARDARGVWGNPRQKNTHRPESSAREFSAWVREANNEAAVAAEKGEAGDAVGMLDHVISAAYALGRAAAERRYAGSEINQSDARDFRDLINGRSKWAQSVLSYMRDVMGLAANPSRKKNVGTRDAACTVGASAHKSRSAAARQCGAKWKASATKFASTGGKAAARSSKSPIGKKGKRRSKRRRNPEPKARFKAGDRVERDDASSPPEPFERGEVAIVGAFDDYGDFRRYKVEQDDGSRIWWNDPGMRKSRAKRSRNPVDRIRVKAFESTT